MLSTAGHTVCDRLSAVRMVIQCVASLLSSLSGLSGLHSVVSLSGGGHRPRRPLIHHLGSCARIMPPAVIPAGPDTTTFDEEQEDCVCPAGSYR
jgi:hypothetical protein